jgi:hypothetical protein
MSPYRSARLTLHRRFSPAGALSLSAAAFNDALAWCLLALAIAMVQKGPPITALYILLLVLLYAAFLWVAVRPCLAEAVRMARMTRKRSWRSALLALIFICIFLSGWVTAFIGLDAIFGTKRGPHTIHHTHSGHREACSFVYLHCASRGLPDRGDPPTRRGAPT